MVVLLSLLKSCLRVNYLIVLLMAASGVYGYGESKKHVLIVNSYHPQYAWSSNQNRGAVAYLSGEFADLEIYVEYMDTKRFTGVAYYASLAKAYQQKYSEIKLDAIVTTDDNALDFVMKHHAIVFQSAPVAFSGVNNYDPQVIGNKDGFTGTAGTFDTGPTFETAFKLHPQVKNVYVVVDTTPTGLGMRRQIEKTAEKFNGYRFEFLTSDDYTTEMLQEKLRGIGDESMVLMAVWFRDKEGVYYSYEEATALVAQASAGPVYGIVRMQLGCGIVGGQLIDGYTHGRVAGEMAARFLRGEKPRDIAIRTENFNPYMFDAEQLKRWDVDRSLLPEGSVLINERTDLFDQYYGWGLLSVVAILVLLVMFQMVAMVARRRSEERLRISEQKHRELFETMRQGVVYQDTSGKIISVNPAAMEILGVDESEMHQRDSSDPRWQAVDENEQPVPGDNHPAMVALRTGERVSDVVMGIYNPVKDCRRWIMVSAVPLFKAGATKPFQVYATITDITERQETERALEEAQAMFSQLSNNIPEIFWLGSPDWQKIYYISPAYEKVWGRSCQEMYDNPLSWVESLHPDDVDKVSAVFADRDENDSSDANFPDYRIVRPDGEVRWISARGFPVLDEHGKVYRIAGIAEDITNRKRQEQQLAEAEAMMKTSLEAIPIGLVIARKDEGVFHTVNAAALEMLGREAGGRVKVEEIAKYWEARHPDGRLYEQEELPLVRAMVDGEVTENQPMVVRRLNDGKTFYFLLNAAPIRDEDGEIIAGVVVFPDVTDLKDAEQALKDSELKYRALVENSPDIIMRFDRAYSHIFVSSTVTRLTGMKAADFIGKTYRELGFDEEKVVYWESQIEKTFQTSQPVVNEIEFEGIEGNVILNWRLMPEFDDEGKVNTVLSIASDITAQRKAQRDYQYLFDQMIDGFAVHEMIYDEMGDAVDYRFLAVNPSFERMTGLKADDVVGKTVMQVLPDTEKHWIDTYAHVVETGEPFFFENYAQAMDKYFSVVAFRPGPGQFACSFEDVTARKKAEAERERLLEETEAKNAELERFTYTVSHDLKSPLITIKGYLGMIGRDVTKGCYDDITSDLKRIGKAADRMHSLLDELLELSRIGRLENPPVEMRLTEVAQEAAELVEGQIKERGVEVVIEGDLPVVVGDRPRIMEVFQNLLDNAVKYIGNRKDGKVEIGVRNGETEQVIYVKDNGVGIDPKYQTKVFGLFDQLDSDATGTGIGLALVKRIVEVHHGRIWVESEGADKGSTFCFTLGGGK